jgi:hypothetical protein
MFGGFKLAETEYRPYSPPKIYDSPTSAPAATEAPRSPSPTSGAPGPNPPFPARKY